MIAREFHPNPFYEGAGTVVVEDTATGRRQHFAIWAHTTRREFIARARHALKAVRLPLPDATGYTGLRLTPNRRRDDDGGWA